MTLAEEEELFKKDYGVVHHVAEVNQIYELSSFNEFSQIQILFYFIYINVT